MAEANDHSFENFVESNYKERLPCFYGNSDVNKFLSDFEARVALITNDCVKQAILLKNSLKDKAWDRYVLHQNDVQTFAELKMWIRKQFGDTARIPIALYKILTMHQYLDEDVATYATRVQTGWNHVNAPQWPMTDANAQKIILSILFAQIKPALAQKIPSDFCPETVDEFLEKARRLEAEIIDNLHNVTTSPRMLAPINTQESPQHPSVIRPQKSYHRAQPYHHRQNPYLSPQNGSRGNNQQNYRYNHSPKNGRRLFAITQPP